MRATRPIGAQNIMNKDRLPSDDEIAEAVNAGNHKMWSVVGRYYFPCEKAIECVPPGQYLPAQSDDRGTFLIQKDVTLDDLLVLPDSKTTQILESIRSFWTKEEAFRKHGFLWKRGLMLWGPPGSGKSSCVQQLSKQVIDLGGVSFYCNIPTLTAEALRVFRNIESSRPVVVIMEDIDAIVEQYGESQLLALLDGELQIDNVVFVATTNYPEKLDKRFANRPSRFDEIIYIGMPRYEARKMYFLAKNSRLKDSPEELDLWVRSTKGFSLAMLKEVVVSVECLGHEFGKTLERLEEMRTKKWSSESPPDKGGIGFTTSYEEVID